MTRVKAHLEERRRQRVKEGLEKYGSVRFTDQTESKLWTDLKMVYSYIVGLQKEQWFSRLIYIIIKYMQCSKIWSRQRDARLIDKSAMNETICYTIY